jgi:hypothetical protein
MAQGLQYFRHPSPNRVLGEVKTRGKSPSGQGYRRGGAEGYLLAGSVRGAGLLFCAGLTTSLPPAECDNTLATDPVAQAGPENGQREAPQHVSHRNCSLPGREHRPRHSVVGGARVPAVRYRRVSGRTDAAPGSRHRPRPRAGATAGARQHRNGAHPPRPGTAHALVALQ